jgi:hypothetical protein
MWNEGRGGASRFAVLLCLCAGASFAGADQPAAVELVLALDSSASVDRDEFALEVHGLSQAFRDPEVIRSIGNLGPSGVAVAIIQWGGPGDAKVVVPWIQVQSARDCKALAHIISRMQRWQRSSITAIGSAMTEGKALIESNGYDGARRIIDISGDGADNASGDLEAKRQAAETAGITINGLAIESDDAGLTSYYRDHVIAGNGAFVVTARDYADFARAMKEKLLRELRPLQS